MSKSSKQDAIYSEPREAITDFVFDQSVVQVFQDMIGRSVPGYSTLLSMIPVLMRQNVQQNSRCYDLGCSLGAATLAMRHSINRPNVKLIAVDNSTAMVERCREYIEKDKSDVPVKILCDDINNVAIEQASIVVMNFTLQFFEKEKRFNIIEKIFKGLNKGGAFLLSEKIEFKDSEDQKWITSLHHEFKKANGYSDLEISQKRTALEDVLIPETIKQHQDRLKKAGFEKSIVWFQCFNFVSILAIK
jgi:tRNA (cmo5U34)-methyltransferase